MYWIKDIWKRTSWDMGQISQDKKILIFERLNYWVTGYWGQKFHNGVQMMRPLPSPPLNGYCQFKYKPIKVVLEKENKYTFICWIILTLWLDLYLNLLKVRCIDMTSLTFFLCNIKQVESMLLCVCWCKIVVRPSGTHICNDLYVWLFSSWYWYCFVA